MFNELYQPSLAHLPTHAPEGVRFAYLVNAQEYARTTNQDKYWRIIYFEEHSRTAKAAHKQAFFMSKEDYLYCLSGLAAIGYRVDGSILYTDKTSNSPNAR